MKTVKNTTSTHEPYAFYVGDLTQVEKFNVYTSLSKIRKGIIAPHEKVKWLSINFNESLYIGRAELNFHDGCHLYRKANIKIITPNYDENHLLI